MAEDWNSLTVFRSITSNKVSWKECVSRIKQKPRPANWGVPPWRAQVCRGGPSSGQGAWSKVTNAKRVVSQILKKSDPHCPVFPRAQQKELTFGLAVPYLEWLRTVVEMRISLKWVQDSKTYWAYANQGRDFTKEEQRDWLDVNVGSREVFGFFSFLKLRWCYKTWSLVRKI